jgi:hypothetical protein
MIPVVDIAAIADDLRGHAKELIRAFEEEDYPRGDDVDPRGLIEVLQACLDKLRGIEPRAYEIPSASLQDECGPNIQAIGDHALDVLSRLTALAGRLRRPQSARGIEGLALPLACWIARTGGELSHLAPVVNATAALASSLKEPTQLERLYGLLSEVIGAVSPQISQDTASKDPTRPWRILLLNRAIVATRSHQVALMEDAFESLTEQLPDDAPEFFREGIEQMEALNYPPHVRTVMQRYYDQWCTQRMLLH